MIQDCIQEYSKFCDLNLFVHIQVEIEKLAKENEALRNGNDHLKLRLESLRVQNGGKCERIF